MAKKAFSKHTETTFLAAFKPCGGTRTDAALEVSLPLGLTSACAAQVPFTCSSLSMSRQLHAAVHWATMYVYNLSHADTTTATLRAPTPTS